MSDIEGQITAAFRDLGPRVALLLMHRYRLTYEDAVDVVHDVLSSLLSRSRDLPFDDPDHLRNYIIRAAHSRAIDVARRELRHRKHEDVLMSALAPAGEPSALDRVIVDEQRKRLREAIASLNEPYHSIFTALLYDELSLADIARKLGISAGSIYTQYARGVERLRSLLQSSS